MATKCPACRSDNPGTVKFCGECGAQLPAQGSIRNSFSTGPLCGRVAGSVIPSNHRDGVSI